jgi:tRNA dimethylallyltransferase
MEDDRLLVLAGPTASGKTAAAIALAREFPLEIVNADSMQVYRGMDIGTAKPPRRERDEIPHHLLDIVAPDEGYSAGRFVEDAGRAIRDIRARGRFPLLAGGTGLYIRALVRGLDALPCDPRVRERLARRWEEEGGDILCAELRRTDPAAAARIHPADRLRVLRALEVAEITGSPVSARRTSWNAEGSGRRVLFLALRAGREELYRRIDARVDGMFRSGLLDEVRGLLSRGYGPRLRSMQALGYRHALSHLLGGLPLERSVREMKRDTRRYAKRQMTWLAGEEGVRWIEADSAVSRAREISRKFLL